MHVGKARLEFVLEGVDLRENVGVQTADRRAHFLGNLGRKRVRLVLRFVEAPAKAENRRVDVAAEAVHFLADLALKQIGARADSGNALLHIRKNRIDARRNIALELADAFGNAAFEFADALLHALLSALDSRIDVGNHHRDDIFERFFLFLYFSGNSGRNIFCARGCVLKLLLYLRNREFGIRPYSDDFRVELARKLLHFRGNVARNVVDVVLDRLCDFRGDSLRALGCLRKLLLDSCKRLLKRFFERGFLFVDGILERRDAGGDVALKRVDFSVDGFVERVDAFRDLRLERRNRLGNVGTERADFFLDIGAEVLHSRIHLVLHRVDSIVDVASEVRDLRIHIVRKKLDRIVHVRLERGHFRVNIARNEIDLLLDVARE